MSSVTAALWYPARRTLREPRQALASGLLPAGLGSYWCKAKCTKPTLVKKHRAVDGTSRAPGPCPRTPVLRMRASGWLCAVLCWQSAHPGPSDARQVGLVPGSLGWADSGVTSTVVHWAKGSD